MLHRVFLCLVLAASACGDAARSPGAADAIGKADGQGADGLAEDSGSAAETIAPTRCALTEGAAVTLPADDARHDAATEWYYWTGHLQSEDGRWFGFHLTVVVAGPRGHGIVLAHHSLVQAGSATYQHGFELGIEGDLPASGFDLEVGAVHVRGDDGEDVLSSTLRDSRLELAVSDVRGPVVRHGTGYQDYGGGIATWYYARPRMSASGTLQVGDETLAVRGSVWFDHQWGTLATPEQSRWDWIAIQLDDQRELMVLRLPTPGGPELGYAELTGADCTTTIFSGAEVTLVGAKQWQSPSSGCTYPIGWQVQVGDLHFDLTPLADDQEMHAEPIPYWEGAATVTGSATGRAYVELVGYCRPD